MQIIIEFNASKDAKQTKEEVKLLSRLKNDGYRINALVEKLVYDVKRNGFIEILKLEEIATCDIEQFLTVLHQQDAKLAIISTDHKSVAFTEGFFPAVYGFIDKRKRPVSFQDINDNYAQIILEENEKLLRHLYFKSYKRFMTQRNKYSI